VELGLFDVRGRLVRTWAGGSFEIGSHSLPFATLRGEATLAAGSYYLTLRAPGSAARTKVLVLPH
jgi:hypothetical protein